MLYVVLDDDNYIKDCGINCKIGNATKVDADIETLDKCLSAYKLVDDELILDENKKAEIEQQNALNELRAKRQPLLSAFDIWLGNVNGRLESTDPLILAWRLEILDLDETALNNPPERIKYYMKG